LDTEEIYFTTSVSNSSFIAKFEFEEMAQINENINDQFILFANPSWEDINFSFVSPGKIMLKIYDVKGKLVFF